MAESLNWDDCKNRFVDNGTASHSAWIQAGALSGSIIIISVDFEQSEGHSKDLRWDQGGSQSFNLGVTRNALSS
ncbi:hypothetical protein O1611_g6432 [Lasiodiplodia mahajangana]|uniref:Uncharacterized protein n=1 Tax=Lasiodiplodia mahajangana TaxID=1108764 RepID=A0ACC2JI80_9PEZI|nr:hypothetical protein O1611_g6432 [Lasiodiplodia mahajangana]